MSFLTVRDENIEEILDEIVDHLRQERRIKATYSSDLSFDKFEFQLYDISSGRTATAVLTKMQIAGEIMYAGAGIDYLADILADAFTDNVS